MKKKIVATILCFVMCFMVCPQQGTFASQSCKPNQGNFIDDVSRHTGALWTSATETYYLYKDGFGHFVYPAFQNAMFYNGGPSGQLTSSISIGLRFDTAVEYNSAVGVSVGYSGILDTSANAGVGISTGVGIDFQFVAQVTLSVPKGSKVGYYRVIPATDCHFCHYDKYVTPWNGTKKYSSTGTFYMPTGSAYWLRSYSADNTNWIDI